METVPHPRHNTGRTVVIGRNAEPEVLPHKTGSRNAATERESVAAAQPPEIGVAALVESPSAGSVSANEPPGRDGPGKTGPRKDRSRLKIVRLRNTIDRHPQVRDLHLPADPPTGRGKPGTPDTQRRPGRKPGPGPRIHRITPRNDGHTDVETQKRRSAPPVLKLHGTFDIQSPILENQIRKVVTQFGRKDADPGSSTITSLIQCRLFSIRPTPVAVASV